VRYEWLAQYLFDTIDEVQDFATQWLWNYNHERPNMALGGFTPKQRLAMAAWFLPAATAKKGGITTSLRKYSSSSTIHPVHLSLKTFSPL
jgi:putative transposase